MTPYYYLLIGYIMLLVLAKLAYAHFSSRREKPVAKKHLMMTFRQRPVYNNRIYLFFNTIFSGLIKYP
jgi:hypothetical protein